MGLLIRFLELLLLLLPLIGLIAAGIKAISSMNRRVGETAGDSVADQIPGARQHGRESRRESGTVNPTAQWQAIRRAIDAHERTDTRWLEYELDATRLLDFPVMTDMREPLTTRFHKAKLRADLCRPVRAEDLLDDRDAADRYLEAVGDYATAFDAAEAESMRRRRSDFSSDEQQRLTRAQNLLRVAADTAATGPERKHAYGLARAELDGLIVLPDNTRNSLESGISGEIDG